MCEFLPNEACCFTGHRPNKLLGSEEQIRVKLRDKIKEAITSGVNTFITGMAPGVDTWAAFEVLAVKKDSPNIKLVCAVPFCGVENNRSEIERNEFRKIIQAADLTIYVCGEKARWSFNARDRWMVDHSARVIAIFNGTPGGTEFTINYARKKNREICVITEDCRES